MNDLSRELRFRTPRFQTPRSRAASVRALPAVAVGLVLVHAPVSGQGSAGVVGFDAIDGFVPGQVALPSSPAGDLDLGELLPETAVIGIYMEPGPDLCNPDQRGYQDMRMYVLSAGPESRVVVSPGRSRAAIHVYGELSHFRPGADFCDGGEWRLESRDQGSFFAGYETAAHMSPRNFQTTGENGMLMRMERWTNSNCGLIPRYTGNGPICQQLNTFFDQQDDVPIEDGIPWVGYLAGPGVSVRLRQWQPAISTAPNEMGGGVDLRAMMGAAGVDVDEIRRQAGQEPGGAEMLDAVLDGRSTFAGALADDPDVYRARTPFTIVFFNVTTPDDPSDLGPFPGLFDTAMGSGN